MKHKVILPSVAVLALVVVALLSGFTYPQQVIFFAMVCAFFALLWKAVRAGLEMRRSHERTARE